MRQATRPTGPFVLRGLASLWLAFLMGTNSAHADGAAAPFVLTVEQRTALRRALPRESAGKQSVTIHGSKTPELFFRWELVSRLIHTCLVSEQPARRAFRAGVDRTLREAGLPSIDWRQLEDAYGPSVENALEARRQVRLRNSSTESGRKDASRQLEALQAEECALRALGTATAIDKLGLSAFDTLLYRGVAPSTFVVFIPANETVEKNQRAEEGCQ